MRKNSFTLIVLLVIFAFLLSSCAPQDSEIPDEEPLPDPNGESEAFDWMQHSGESIKIITNNHKIHELVYLNHIDEFEELTGITVEYEIMDSSSLRSTLPVQLAARASEFDVMATMTAVDGLQFNANGWFEPLDDYMNDPLKTDPDWGIADFPEGIQEAMKVDGNTVSIWWESQTSLLYYRKSVLEEHGLQPPQTFEDWVKVAETVNDPDNDFYGVALRGAGVQVTTPFAPFLYGHCGSWVDENGNASINTEEAVNAFELYGKLGGQFGPPGIVAFDWQEPAQQFAQGNVATFLDINLFLPTLENEEESRVAGDVGYAMVPEGPCGRTPFVAGWGWSINPFSENKDAAWMFIQWATNKDNNLRTILAGLPAPRTSAWNSPEFKEQDQFPEYTQVNLESYQIATALMNPPVNPGLQAREIAGFVGVLALQGGTRDEIQTAANAANVDLQLLIDEMGTGE